MPDELEDLKNKKRLTYWLRSPLTPDPSYPSSVRVVKDDEFIFDYFGYFSHSGIRPALSLSKSLITFKSGSGIESDPYVLKVIEEK